VKTEINDFFSEMTKLNCSEHSEEENYIF